MRDIEVFYHFVVPADMRHSAWPWWIDEQLSLLRESRLAEIAKINMTITAPVHWMTPHDKVNNYGYVISKYISDRYPFVNILELRDTGDVNLYEGATIRYLYRACQERDINVLYFHSKGMFSQSVPVVCWRQILNHFVVKEWPTCVKHLERDDIDVVGVRDGVNLDHMVSGNFWWSKSSYIKTRPNPIDSTTYQTRPSFFPGGADYRYSFEDWLWFGHPRVHHVCNTNADHYNESVYLENILKKSVSSSWQL